MITANHLRIGMTIDIEGGLYEVEEFQHVKRGRGGAFVRTKLRGLQTLQSIRKVFQPEQRIKDAFIEERSAQYLYQDGEDFHFMDSETFEERVLSKDILGKKVDFIRENIEVKIRLYEEKLVGIELPVFVELRVKKADPGVKGDTVGSATKLVILESGYSLRVPLFIKEGDIIRLDTRSGEYVSKS
ncbi:elongation factor P [Candidatus Aerophobetes bacterium]|uniref:Elongation factor P n=1 Tax=Aerophobetes bacterium TaxID=2030807 RepID=A0A523YSA6_UNCAE|nr:MAG: elongation factor P [Candidatus Aerophobetes bacterium]